MQNIDSAKKEASGSQTRRRKTVRLRETLGQRLTTYSLTAGAACLRPETLNGRLAFYAVTAGAVGLGLLALVPPADADVIYTQAQIGIIALQNQSVYFPIDLNRDGHADLSFNAENFFSLGFPNHFSNRMRVAPAPGNALDIGPLARGYRIGPHAKFFGSALLASSVGHSSARTFQYGPWVNKTGYLGVRFLIEGQTHYGWVALSAGTLSAVCGTASCGTVTGYAYETIANEAIRAGQTTQTPEPGTLGLLALGSLGLGFWRRRKKQETVASGK